MTHDCTSRTIVASLGHGGGGHCDTIVAAMGSSCTTANVILGHCTPKLLDSPCTADELHVFSYFSGKFLKYSKKLIPLIDSLNQCSGHHTCLKHTVK